MKHSGALAAAAFGLSVLATVPPRPARATEGAVIDDMESGPLPAIGQGAHTSEAVEGRFGRAVRLTFPDKCMNLYFRTRVRGAPEWDACDGFSFWVKGDGSKEFGCLQFIWNEDYAARYDCAFALDSTEWRKVVVPWSDLVPVLPRGSCLFLGKGEGRNPPSKLSQLWIGKWWYWKQYGAHSFAVDRFQLEPKIDSPAPRAPAGAPLARVLAKLKAGKPVTIVTMGDSLTDYAHWANREVNWPTLLKESLEAKYGSKVTIVNPAIGGTELRQNLVLVPRWLAGAPEPDLVTVCFGYNDWASGMKGPMFRETYEFGIDRLRRLTGGKADVLVVTTCPAVEKWDEMAELAEACREAAKAKRAGLADVYAAFHREGAREKERLFASDKTHMGPEGHRLIAREVAASVERAGR